MVVVNRNNQPQLWNFFIHACLVRVLVVVDCGMGLLIHYPSLVRSWSQEEIKMIIIFVGLGLQC